MLSCRNILDIVAYAAQIAITVMHMGRLELASNGLSVIMALQVLILWVKVQYFARCAACPIYLSSITRLSNPKGFSASEQSASVLV